MFLWMIGTWATSQNWKKKKHWPRIMWITLEKHFPIMHGTQFRWHAIFLTRPQGWWWVMMGHWYSHIIVEWEQILSLMQIFFGHAISNPWMGQYSQQPYNGNDHKIHHSSKCFFENFEWVTMLHRWKKALVQIEGIHPYEVCETKKINCAILFKDEIEMNNQTCTFNGHIYLSI